MKQMQVGMRNAIILWEDTTGSIDAMRRCLAEEFDVQRNAYTKQKIGDQDSGGGVDPVTQLCLTFNSLGGLRRLLVTLSKINRYA